MSQDRKVPLRKPKIVPQIVEAPKTQEPLDFNAPAMPMVPGQIVMTAGEKRDLKAVGWKPGMAIPGDLARRIQACKDEFLGEESVLSAAEKRAQSGHVLKVPAPVNLEDLPAEKREGLIRSVEEAQRHAEVLQQMNEQAAAAGTLDPSVRAAMMEAGAGQFIDSRMTDADSPLLPPQTQTEKVKLASGHQINAELGLKALGTDFKREIAAQMQAEREQAEYQVAPAADKADPRPSPPIEEEQLFTKDDFLAFYTAEFLNSSNVRYLKTYNFMGGRMELTFRTPRMKHVEAIWTQIKTDQLAGRIVSMDDLWRTLIEYNMVISLHQLKVGGGTVTVSEDVDGILDEDWKEYITEPDGTPLPYLVKTLQGQAPFSSESCWRLVGRTWQKFDKLVKAMEAKMGDESFCKAIGI